MCVLDCPGFSNDGITEISRIPFYPLKHYVLQFQKGEKLTDIKLKKCFLLIQDLIQISLHSLSTMTKNEFLIFSDVLLLKPSFFLWVLKLYQLC